MLIRLAEGPRKGAFLFLLLDLVVEILLRWDMAPRDRKDILKATKLIKRLGYEGLQVRSRAGNFSYVLFLKPEYLEKHKSYPPSSAMHKHHADYIFDYLQNKWTKELTEIELTPAEEVLYG